MSLESLMNAVVSVAVVLLAADTATDTTTRSTFKIEDPSRGPGRVDVRSPDEGFRLEGTPKPKIQRGPSPRKRRPYRWYAAVRTMTD